MKHLLTLGLALALSVSGAALAQHEHGAMLPADVGSASVQFDTSCAIEVKDDFNKGVWLLHSFWFPEATKAFEAVLKKDSNCAMAHWGIALSYYGTPFGILKPTRVLDLTKVAIESATITGSPTPRERAYIDAVATLVTTTDPASQVARIGAYEVAMGKVAADNPADAEARIFFALAVIQAAEPTDTTYARNLKAAGILEPLFAQMPTHPGLAHYIIHAFDVPPLAARGLEAARRYASLAPAVPHALHMPSHIFTRLGYWKESIDTNRRSAEAARTSNGAGEEIHALDYQAYAHLQIGQDKAARIVVDHVATMNAAVDQAVTGEFGAFAIPARYALERGAWAEAAALTPRSAKTAMRDVVTALTHFARAIGAARSGHPDAAAPDINQLAACRDRLHEAKDGYWTEQVNIQWQTATAWQNFAGGRREEGLAQMNSAADAEDATEKSPVSPGPLAPARELYGEMLLEAGKPKQALVAFEATMKKEPNRFRALYGAASAAEKADDRSKARAYYRRLLNVAHDADTERPELQQAKRFAGR